MNNKSIFIVSIIRNSIIVLVLFFIFFHNTGISRIMIIPFITCGFFSLGKNISLLINNRKWSNVFSRLFVVSFLVFWFGFLILWSYLVIKENNYFFLLFTIPFWIVGIYIIRKYLMRIETKKSSKNKKTTPNFKIIISGFLVTVTLLVGLFCLVFGIKDTYKLNKVTKNYTKTNGYLVDYEIYNLSNSSKDDKDLTYRLIYVYEVAGTKYTVSTDYGVSYIPKNNSIRKVKYNPSNPSESVLIGTNSKNFLIYFGAFFTLGSVAFVLGALYMKGFFDKIKIDIIGLYLGFTFLIIGVGFLLYQNGMQSSFIETIKSLGMWIVLPVLFIVVGVFLIIKCLFLATLKSKKK